MRGSLGELETLLREILSPPGDEPPVATLRRLVDALRPRRPSEAKVRLDTLCDVLQEGPPARGERLAGLLRAVARQASCVHELTEAGMPPAHGFFEELATRLSRRVLPEVEERDDLGPLLGQIFPRADDHVWLRAAGEETWLRLLDLLGLQADAALAVPRELEASVRILAHNVASLGLAPEITHRMPELDRLDSPFLTLPDQIRSYCGGMAASCPAPRAGRLDPALETLAACRAAVERLRAKKHRFGTSLRLTASSFRLLRQIERLELLLHLTDPEQRGFQRALLRLFLDLVEDRNTRNHVRRHVRESADLLAYQVVEHAARRGRHYITADPREYLQFFLDSVKGGAIVAVFALFKVLLAGLPLSLAARGLLFGLDYALCFVILHLVGGALATKQPALTANTIAHSMDGPPGGCHQLQRLADLVVRAFRSQFISLVGNLVAALPLGYALTALAVGAGWRLAGPEKAASLLAANHPWHSGALAYAAVAGVFLFLSGLVSGYFDNRNLYRRISPRIQAHPLLQRLLGPHGAAALARGVDEKGGAILGNVFLGFCLGSAGVVGQVVGLPFDIRHVAFSSTQLGAGVALGPPGLEPSFLLEVALGVAAIGLVNFLVSFWLALAMAVESRRLTLREHRAVLHLLLRRLLRRPWDYLLPTGGADVDRACASAGED